MPNVLKVFLENGQTKSFKYDNKTTVKVNKYFIEINRKIRSCVATSVKVHAWGETETELAGISAKRSLA